MPGYTYSRIDNPTVDAFARAVAALEGVNLPRWPAAQAFASGMAAISGVFWTFARTGAHVVASAAVYGGTYGFLRNVASRFGVETDFVDITDLDQVQAAIRPSTRIVYARRSRTRPRRSPICASWPTSRTKTGRCSSSTRPWPRR